MIYEGIFNSVLTYCMPVWGGLSKSEMEDLQVMQNKAIRATFKRPARYIWVFNSQTTDILSHNS